MTRHLVRGTTVLLLLGLAVAFLAQEEIRFLLAAAAIGGLVEIGLALRARRSGPRAAGDRSRFAAAQVSCTEKDETVTVTLTGQDAPRGAAPYVLLSRTLRSRPQAGATDEDRPYLELSGRRWSVHGGIQDAYLSPRLLRVTLDAQAAGVVGASQVCVTLRAGYDQRLLERVLRRILRGVAFVSERSMPEEAADAPPGLAP